jgi:molybdate transport system substrate-binding protein
LFFSANLEYPKRLEAVGLTEPGTYYQYARGKLVIWVPKESRLNLGSGVTVLLDPSTKKIAIANPEHAPYGQAAAAALRSERMYDKVKDELVFGENASQAASFATAGAADAAIVPMSLALSPTMTDRGRYVEVPPLTIQPSNKPASFWPRRRTSRPRVSSCRWSRRRYCSAVEKLWIRRTRCSG